MTTNKLDNQTADQGGQGLSLAAQRLSEDPLLREIKAELDQSCAALDGQTLSQLKRIRHQALEAKSKSRFPLLLPFGGLVTASVLVFSLMILDRPNLPASLPTGASALEDIEILSSKEELELYENYEFYQWLADNDSSV